MTARADYANRDGVPGAGGCLLMAVGLAVAAIIALGAVSAPLDQIVVGETDLQMGTHATEKHGMDAVTVRNQFISKMDQATFQRPPCRDGRWRFIDQVADGTWAITVWEQVPGRANTFREVTSFTTRDQAYVRQVAEQCGNGQWLGHAYGN